MKRRRGAKFVATMKGPVSLAKIGDKIIAA